MKNILIPTDFSENSWNAIEYALHLFSKSPCNFYLLHVTAKNALVGVGVDDIRNPHIDFETLTIASRKRLQDTIKRVHEKFPKSSQHRFFAVSDSNYLINSIREQVIQKKINLIVMGTKGSADLNKFAIGNNAGNVITKVKCATVVVPENAVYQEPKEIAFPTDFSIFYRPETLQPILDIVETNKASINVMHVNRFEMALNEDQQKNKDYLDDYFGNYCHSFHFITNNYIEDAIQKFVDDKNINLITMLAKNLNYFQKILFHPTSKEISYYKNIPFLVLH